MPRWLIIIGSIFVLLYLIGKAFAYNHHLSFIPDGMGVWRIVYAKEESWGFGPGGNESGVIVYSLPDSTAEEIQKTGIKYFSNLPKRVLNLGDHLRGIYENWHDTPLEADWVTKRTNHESLERPYTTGIASYLYQFGFTIDPDVEGEINESIKKTGSFYARGRTGIIIVAPHMHKVFYVYSG